MLYEKSILRFCKKKINNPIAKLAEVMKKQFTTKKNAQ